MPSPGYCLISVLGCASRCSTGGGQLGALHEVWEHELFLLPLGVVNNISGVSAGDRLGQVGVPGDVALKNELGAQHEERGGGGGGSSQNPGPSCRSSAPLSEHQLSGVATWMEIWSVPYANMTVEPQKPYTNRGALMGKFTGNILGRKVWKNYRR